MAPFIFFGFLLIVTFGAVVWTARPTKHEADVERHLGSIGRMFTVREDGSTILKDEALSSVPWLNDLLRRAPGALSLRLFISQAGFGWAVSSLLLGSLGVFFLVTWGAFFWAPSMLLAVLIGIVVASSPYGYLYFKRSMRFKRFDMLLPETVDLMARGLRAGHSITSVIEMVAQEIAEPISTEFRIVFEEQNLGLPLREAILNLAHRVPLDDVRFLVTAILVQKDTGGNLAEVLDKTSAVMRERNRLRGQLRIYTAQGRISGWILCCLPFIVFFLISLVNHNYEKALWTDPLGRHLIYAGLAMMAIGVFAIRKIVSIKV